MKNIKKILATFILLILALGGLVVFQSFGSSTTLNQKEYILEVKEGDNLLVIGQKLADDKAMNWGPSLWLNSFMKPKFLIQQGQYSLNFPATPSIILESLETQSKLISDRKNSKKTESIIKVTIKEGATIDEIIDVLASKNLIDPIQARKIARDPQFFENLKGNYEFLPQALDCKYGDTSICAKYYIEGYLYPDTYEFYIDDQPETIFGKLLDNYELKVWNKVKSQVKDKKAFQKVMIMASVVEKETGRPIEGVNASNYATLLREKQLIASVFYNRIEDGTKWQSDPTGSYGLSSNLCQTTLVSQKNCLYLNNPEVENSKYNTYKISGYPVGPITSPQLDAIQSALNPIESQYMLFVSDASGKKYFAVDNAAHEDNIAKVQEINKKYR